jgi:hypothetical protein
MVRRSKVLGRGILTSEGITAISVGGFKSLFKDSQIEIRPLTILAGANSSGKSSMMQPLLLLKQTLESPYDAGPLRLLGPNVRITSAQQAMSLLPNRKRAANFHVATTVMSASARAIPLTVKIVFTHTQSSGLKVSRIVWTRDKEASSVNPHVLEDRKGISSKPIFQEIRWVIHVPGIRGNPERMYPRAAIGPVYAGTFEPYTASIIDHWQATKDARLNALNRSLSTLGLTWKVQAKAVDDAQIELLVGRLRRRTRAGDKDLVNIADVGFGVSQFLPVLVALLAAKPGQLVYIEQPELHLHPRAQKAMAEVLAEAARRGVRVIAETHSSMLLLAVQTLVAQKKLDPALVKLHWFQRGEDGATTVTSADLDERGAFGDWPEDFGDVELETESAFLDGAQRVR